MLHVAKFEDHCAESARMFGNSFAEVHRWLDEFAGSPGHRMRHRRKRHHLAGIEEAAKLFGENARSAAMQHVITDLKEEGWTDRDRFPANERDYVKMGFF